MNLQALKGSGIELSASETQSLLMLLFTPKGECGAGLDVNMVYGTIRRQADIRIKSEPAESTAMRLIFPVSVFACRQRSSPGHLLHVDDHPLLLRSLSALSDTLETDGHLERSADDGEAGISLLLLGMAGSAEGGWSSEKDSPRKPFILPMG